MKEEQLQPESKDDTESNSVSVGRSKVALIWYYSLRLLALTLGITLVVHLTLGFSRTTCYIWGVNFAGFFLFGFDKTRARKGGVRAPEVVFYVVALLGASLGSLIGMRMFRHKTLKHRFQFFLLVTLIVHFFVFYQVYSFSLR